MFKWTRFSPDILKLLVFQPYSQVINGLRHDKRDIRTFPSKLVRVRKHRKNDALSSKKIGVLGLLRLSSA